MISHWTTHLAGQKTAEIGQALSPHSPECAGCGPRNPAGLHLQAVRTATGVEAVHVFSQLQVGAPGIAHGGLVALAFDDLCGFALYTVGASPSPAASPSSTEPPSGFTVPTPSGPE